MTSSIVHGRYLITRASGHETSVLEQGAIYQNNYGVIKEVGAFQELSQKHPDVPVLGGDDFLVMPGLINAHHHGKGVSPLMKGSLDDHLEYWMADSWGRKSVDMYLDTLYACMKMLRSGVDDSYVQPEPRGCCGNTGRLRKGSHRLRRRRDEGELLGVRGEPVPDHR